MVHFIALKLLCLTPFVVSPTDSTEALATKFLASPDCVMLEVTLPFDTVITRGSNKDTTQLEFWYKDVRFYSFLPNGQATELLTKTARGS